MSWPAYTMPDVLPFVFTTFSRDHSTVSRPWSGVSLSGIVVIGVTALVVRRIG